MASSNGSSPRGRPPQPEGRFPWVAALLAVSLLAANAGVAAMPDYLKEALAKFSPDVPAGWAYTRTTVRNDVSATEHFDPSKSVAEQWTLLRQNGRAPTPKDLEKYADLKAANPVSTVQAVFQKGDIEPGSIELVREDAERAEFKCTFRSESTGSDKMLGHLQLHLFVSKHQAHVEKFALGLLAPYSPILGVKMNALTVEMTFSAPTADRPSLPAVSTSLFQGRIFFIGTQEDLRVAYSDFTKAD